MSHLNELLESFTAWCNKWRMVISVPKSKVIALNDASPPAFSIPGRGVMENVKEFKYLGVWFTTYGKWDNDLSKKIARFKGACARAHKTLTLRFLSLWDRTRIWTALCRPVLEYALELINVPHDSPMWRKMRSAQVGSLKKILGAPRSAASALILAECALPSVDSRYDQAHARLFYRLKGVHENNALLPRAVYARSAPKKLAQGVKSSACWLFEEERLKTAWATTERTALAKIAENEAEMREQADESVAEGRDRSPQAAWKEAIHAAAKSLNRQALIREMADLKAPAVRYFTAERRLQEVRALVPEDLRCRPRRAHAEGAHEHARGRLRRMQVRQDREQVLHGLHEGRTPRGGGDAGALCARAHPRAQRVRHHLSRDRHARRRCDGPSRRSAQLRDQGHA